MAAVAFAVPVEPLAALAAAAGRRWATWPGRRARLAATRRPSPDSDGWLVLDPLGKVVLGFLSVLFFLCSLYAPGYLALRADRPNRVFCANLLVVAGDDDAGRRCRTTWG